MQKAMMLLWGVALLLGCQSTKAAGGGGRLASNPTPGNAQEAAVAFDRGLAQKLGADEYGMKSYVLVFLKAGPNRSQAPDEAAELQRAHLANIHRLTEEGKLVLAGPFMDGGDYAGIFILDVASLTEAQAVTASDPAVRAGRLLVELHPWYGSAALLEVNRIHARIAAKKF